MQYYSLLSYIERLAIAVDGRSRARFRALWQEILDRAEREHRYEDGNVRQYLLERRIWNRLCKYIAFV
jgi:predicted GNAT superfamily acetyltransferase